ncbi:centrosomal protein of 55 kDa-like isoform X1 [Pungitius pungitius]|uniref:centrosomal protein of 55 kDa-like isoform X1 n=1 Tax=Pungitius pungitius TaxID=134920 RepID=UPI002E1307F1
MASTRSKRFLRKELKKKSELDVVVISLRAENACLKKTLVQQIRLAERFFSFQTVKLRSSQQLSTKDEMALQSEEMSKKEGKQIDVGLEKNKEWLEYDEQREAYVRATLARMLWLEKQLNAANQALLQQNNEDHSNALIREVEKFHQMQKHHERLLRKAEDELMVLRENFKTIERKLIMTENQCQEREREVDELKQQLQTENMSRTSSWSDDQCCEDEEEWLSAESEDLQCRPDEEKRRLSGFALQFSVFQKLLVTGQEKIAELERQIQIYSQDLEDEKQNCSYLKKKIVRVLQNQQDHTSGLCSRDSATWTPPRNLLNESFLECPSCRAEYPVSHHRELMSHLEICLK